MFRDGGSLRRPRLYSLLSVKTMMPTAAIHSMNKSIIPAALLFMTAAFSSSHAASINGNAVTWHPISIDIEGPAASETDASPNPFLDLRYDLYLTAPSGREVTVPGFYAGDGAGGDSGNVWRARFAPDEPGSWDYRVGFFSGAEVAIASDTDTASTMPAHGESGSFEVLPRDPSAPGLLALGRLEYTGKHYLKFSDGPYWIKSGVNSPENFFGYAGFDQTYDLPDGAGKEGLSNGLHHYQEHRQDWRIDDPLFVGSSGIDSKGIIGAINYLASEAVNSIYFLTMNLGGDGSDTWPFVGSSGTPFDNTHYDLSKLYQWNIVLNHMQEQGIVAHIVLAEREWPNIKWLDDGEFGTERKLYIRELVARYAYLNGIKWNLSEESRLTNEQHRDIASYLRSLDWAAHPISVHHWINQPEPVYEPILGNTDFDLSSIQFSPHNANDFVETWRARTADAGWPWVIDMDEVGPARVGLTDENIDSLRKRVLYPVYFSGGNIEWYFGYHALPLGGDMRLENFRTREPMYRYMRYAREFLEALPFWDMQPADELLSQAGDNDQVFAQIGQTYAVYIEDAANTRLLDVEAGEYEKQWFNPRTGTSGPIEPIKTSGRVALGPLNTDYREDWVIVLRRADTEDAESTDTPSTDNDSQSESDEQTETNGDTDLETLPASTDLLGEAPVQVGVGGLGAAALLLGPLGLALFNRRRRKRRQSN